MDNVTFVRRNGSGAKTLSCGCKTTSFLSKYYSVHFGTLVHHWVLEQHYNHLLYDSLYYFQSKVTKYLGTNAFNFNVFSSQNKRRFCTNCTGTDVPRCVCNNFPTAANWNENAAISDLAGLLITGELASGSDMLRVRAVIQHSNAYFLNLAFES